MEFLKGPPESMIQKPVLKNTSLDQETYFHSRGSLYIFFWEVYKASWGKVP